MQAIVHNTSERLILTQVFEFLIITLKCLQPIEEILFKVKNNKKTPMDDDLGSLLLPLNSYFTSHRSNKLMFTFNHIFATCNLA